MEIHLPREYGYVVLTFVSSIVLLIYLSIKVSIARKKYGVKYPEMYTTDDKKKTFNCVQRSHQNTLENYAPLMMCLLLGGLQHPVLAAGAGMLWIVSRIVYAMGYSTGDPAKRNWGAFGYFGVFALYGCVISLGLHLLEVV